MSKKFSKDRMRLKHKAIKRSGILRRSTVCKRIFEQRIVFIGSY